MNWRTVDLIENASAATGDALSSILNARANQKSENAFKRQWADVLDLPTQQPTEDSVLTPDQKRNFIDALMQRSAASAESQGYQSGIQNENARRRAAADLLNQFSAAQRAARGLPPPVPTEAKPVVISPQAQNRINTANRDWQDAIAADTTLENQAQKGLQEANQRYKMYQDYNLPDYTHSLNLELQFGKLAQKKGGSEGGIGSNSLNNPLPWFKAANDQLLMALKAPAPLDQASQQSYLKAVANYNSRVPNNLKMIPYDFTKPMTPEQKNSILQYLKNLAQPVIQYILPGGQPNQNGDVRPQ